MLRPHFQRQFPIIRHVLLQFLCAAAAKPRVSNLAAQCLDSHWRLHRGDTTVPWALWHAEAPLTIHDHPAPRIWL